MPTLSEITEMASALVLQAPGTDAPLDVLGDWGREVVRFLTWLDTEERKVLFTLTAVSQLHTTFQEQVDARLHHPWRSWGRQWLPLTAKAWEAKMQALMGSPVIGDPLASTQLSSLAIVALPDPSNEDKGGDRAGVGDGITDEKPTHHTHTSQAKRPREEALQGDIRPSDVQTPSSFADRPSNRPRLPLSVKKQLRRMPPSKCRSFNELMQDNNLRDPRVVVLECKRCKKKQPSGTRLCLTVLRLCSQTDEYELSNPCMRCIVDHQKCEWPAGAISKNTEHRVHVSAKYFSPTEDQSAAPKSLGPTLTQSGACAPHVVINLPHKNTVKVTSSARPAPGPSSATTAEQVKPTSDIIQLPTPKRSISPISTWIMELM